MEDRELRSIEAEGKTEGRPLRWDDGRPLSLGRGTTEDGRKAHGTWRRAHGRAYGRRRRKDIELRSLEDCGDKAEGEKIGRAEGKTFGYQHPGFIASQLFSQ